MEIKVLIADDDEGIRLLLKKAIEHMDGFELAGEATDGESALCRARESKPRVVVMDVEMPVMNGVEAAKQILDINPKTIIIFVTAHEQYMPDAFRLYAFDYMVKPFRLDRFEQTFNRIRSLLLEPAPSGEFPGPVKTPATGKAIDKLLIRNKESVSFVDVKDIVLVQREEGNSVIYTEDSRYVTSDGLTELEDRLDKSLFLRCHKSYIINISLVNKIYPYGRWTYIVKLRGTEKDALITHEKFEELEKKFR